MLLNSREFKFLKNYRNLNVKSSAKRKYRDENVFLKGDYPFNLKFDKIEIIPISIFPLKA